MTDSSDTVCYWCVVSVIDDKYANIIETSEEQHMPVTLSINEDEVMDIQFNMAP